MNHNTIYAMAMMLLYTLKDYPRYATLAKLSFTLDRENLESFIDIFCGTTITIPTREEINEAIAGLAYYQSRYVKNYTTKDAQAISGARKSTIANISKNARHINKVLSDVNLE